MGLVLLATPAAFAREQSMLARVTVYWASGGAGSDSWTRNHQAATRVRLRAGHCAVDPRRIPYGSQVVIAGTACLAVDTGKHVVSRRAARKAGRTPAERDALVVDRFFETKRQALAWAGSHPHFMTVEVVLPNERSAPPSMTRVVAPNPSAAPLTAANSVRPSILRHSVTVASRATSTRSPSSLP